MKLLASFLRRDTEAKLRMRRGRLVARLLTGAWRSLPPPPDISAEELSEIAPLLLKSGAGALAWNRIRHSDLSVAPVAQELQQAYRLHSLQAALHERSLKQIVPLLRDSGIEPALVKGWAIAWHYPEPGLRPYGDFDLCVAPSAYAAARTALKSREAGGTDIDLHSGFGKFYERQVEDVFANSQLVNLGDLPVRSLRAEDHLRFLCAHLLRHGASRPLWLCDIAVLLETRAADFDWDRCLGGTRRLADWIACAIGLAHQLLGVEVEGTPVKRRARNLPSWLLPTVLKEWGSPFGLPGQIEVYLRNPYGLWRGLMKELPRHWPNPIVATTTVRGPFNEFPRLPFQVGHVASRTAWLLAQLPGLLGITFHRGS